MVGGGSLPRPIYFQITHGYCKLNGVYFTDRPGVENASIQLPTLPMTFATLTLIAPGVVNTTRQHAIFAAIYGRERRILQILKMLLPHLIF